MARYTDAQYLAILKKAARRINRELRLKDDDDEISVDASGCISPSDMYLEDLVLLQAECMIASREFQEGISSVGIDGVSILDGEQRIDTTQRIVARGTFFESDGNPCKELKRALIEEKMRRARGRMVY